MSLLNNFLYSCGQVDPYIISIEAHSSNVALYKYKFKSERGEWEKTEVIPTYRIVVDPDLPTFFDADPYRYLFDF